MKRNVLDVRKVAFSGKTGDNRSPESLPFPACMASLVETMGDDYGTVIIHAHNREYTKRQANHQFLGATGMAFGLLWHEEFCLSALDLTLVNDHQETIDRGFCWAGYDYTILMHPQISIIDLKKRIVSTIDKGIPVLVFGAFDPPECAIVAGYDNTGDVLIGWSHFQDHAKLETECNGMFRLSGWEDERWMFVIPGEKTKRSLTYAESIRHGLLIMGKEQIKGYFAGQAAYNAWIQMLLSLAGQDDERIQTRFNYHHSLLFSLAELRCWGADFIHDAGATQAGQAFRKIHDLCWKADAVCGGRNWQSMKDTDKREALADVLREIKDLDQQAMAALKSYIGEDE